MLLRLKLQHSLMDGTLVIRSTSGIANVRADVERKAQSEMFKLVNAFTDGDILVFFRRSDVVIAGDIIRTEQYPVFDPRRGGSIQGILDGLNEIIDITVPRFNQQAGTRVVPGHGRILNEADVDEYRDMMTIIRDRIQSYIEKGPTLEAPSTREVRITRRDGLQSPSSTSTLPRNNKVIARCQEMTLIGSKP